MVDQSIYILTGAIQTGKTSCLAQWSLKRNDVFGVLTPVMKGRRIFVDASTKEQFEMEAHPADIDVLQVGKYVFNKSSFKRATEIIRDGLQQPDGWLIVDELGPLELNGEGFHKVINEIICCHSKKVKTIFVIREAILDKAIELFQFDRNSVHLIDTSSTMFKG